MYIQRKIKPVSGNNICTATFIVALFTVAKIWKQLYSLIHLISVLSDGLMNRETVVYIHNGIYLAILKKEILLSVTTWMNLEGIMLNFEIMQTERQIQYQLHLYVEYKTVELTEAESSMVITRNWGKVGNEAILIKDCKISDIQVE